MNNTLTYPNSQRLLSWPKISLKSLAALGTILIISFLAFYIFQVTTVISEGYQLQSDQKKISDLSEENKILELNFTQVNSLQNIDSQIQNLGFEKVEKVDYIQILGGSVVTVDNKVE